MSPLGKGLLASALTLPLVAFVAGVLASPAPVDPDRSRPVIIGHVGDDQPADDRDRPRPPSGDEPGDDDTDDQPYTVVTPPPRDLDDDDDDGDDDDNDHTDDGEGSGDD